MGNALSCPLLLGTLLLYLYVVWDGLKGCVTCCGTELPVPD